MRNAAFYGLRCDTESRDNSPTCVSDTIYLYFNNDLDDGIFHRLLTSMTAVQAEDVRDSFVLLVDLNGHHQEWLGLKNH